MSSLAASRADGYYFPPDYDPAKHGSLNQFRGQHPLRERAKKLDQGILVIRFEMPFNVWCNGCNHLIGKGVRFNAEKKQIGSYFSTKIWSFTMRTPCCSHEIEVQTDPKNTEYVVVKGGRRKAETWTAESAETIELPDRDEDEEAVRAYDDAFVKLERGETDKRKGRELGARIAELYHDSNQKFKNDFALNKSLRRQNRALRKEEQAREVKRKSLGLSDDIKLLPESEEDSFAASLVQFGDSKAFTKKWQQKRRAIKRESIFAPAALTKKPRLAASSTAKLEPLGHVDKGDILDQQSQPEDNHRLAASKAVLESASCSPRQVKSQGDGSKNSRKEGNEATGLDAPNSTRDWEKTDRPTGDQKLDVKSHKEQRDSRREFQKARTLTSAPHRKPPLAPQPRRKSVAEKAAAAAARQAVNRMKFSG